MRTETIGNCVLILGDCMEYLPTIPDNTVTLVHTDPPYIIHSSGNMGKMMECKARTSYDKLISANISDGFDTSFVFKEFERICKTINWQIWCSKKQFAEYLTLATRNGWNWQDICLYRDNAFPNVCGKYQDKDYCMHLWKGRTLTGTYHQKRTDYHYAMGRTKKYAHPALKPLEPILNMIPIGSDEGDTVIDPFMGSGTTGEACIRTGRRFIGIEKDEKFFEMALERLSKTFSKVSVPNNHVTRGLF